MTGVLKALAVVLAAQAVAAGPPSDEPKAAGADPVAAAFRRLEKAGHHWPEEDAAVKALAALGDRA